MTGGPYFWGGVLLFDGGQVAMDPACCCSGAECCCFRLRGKTLTCEMKWGCPIDPQPAVITFSLPWVEADNCWRGTKTGWCTSPADFDVEAVCGPVVGPSIPGPEAINCTEHQTLFVRIKATSNSAWRSVATDTAQSGCLDYTWVDVFNGVLSESSCCTGSPGALTYLKLTGTP